MIDRREAIEKSKTMKRTIFYLFCIWGLTVSSAVAQKRTVSHETGTFVGESSAERPERRVSCLLYTSDAGLRLPRRRYGHLRV